MAEILTHPSAIKKHLPFGEEDSVEKEILMANASETSVLEILGDQILHFDELLSKMQISVADLTHLLLLMELKGFIQCLSGKFYRVKWENSSRIQLNR